jgi:hypothetical protein
MSDVITFIDAIGHDVNDTVAPRIQDFVKTLIQDLSERYRPEIAGELHTKIMNGRVELVGHGIRLELKRRDTGTPVASLDIPVSLSVRVDELAVKLQPGTIKLDVVK